MKKIILMFSLAISTHCMAVELVPFTFGPMVSATGTLLNASPDFASSSAGFGYNVGAFARIKILMLYAQGEVSYAFKKSDFASDNGSGGPMETTLKTKGIDATAIGGIALFGLGDLGNFRLFVGYNWSNFSDIKYEFGNQSASGTDNISKHNHSILGGVGVDLLKLTVDLRYLHGVSDISKVSSAEIKSSIYTLTLGFKIK